MLNFDSNPRDRNEVQKNKWTLVYQTDLNGESEKTITVFSPIGLLFFPKYDSPSFILQRTLHVNTGIICVRLKRSLRRFISAK